MLAAADSAAAATAAAGLAEEVKAAEWEQLLAGTAAGTAAAAAVAATAVVVVGRAAARARVGGAGVEARAGVETRRCRTQSVFHKWCQSKVHRCRNRSRLPAGSTREARRRCTRSHSSSRQSRQSECTDWRTRHLGQSHKNTGPCQAYKKTGPRQASPASRAAESRPVSRGVVTPR